MSATDGDRAVMTKVALSGASGNIGQVLRPALLERGVDLRSAGGAEPLTPLTPGEDVLHGDLRDPAVVDRLLEGIDVLIHMAGTSVERPLPEIIENNLIGLHAVYEGARRHGVRRVVFASSNHAIGMYPVENKLGLDCDFRPDGLYGLSKIWGEAHGPDVLGQARHRGDLPAHRQHPAAADRVPPPEHLARPRRSRSSSSCAASRRPMSAISSSGACRTTPAATGTTAAPNASATGPSRTPRTTPRRS